MATPCRALLLPSTAPGRAGVAGVAHGSSPCRSLLCLQEVDIAQLRYECHRLFSQESLKTYIRKNARLAPYEDKSVWIVAVG